MEGSKKVKLIAEVGGHTTDMGENKKKKGIDWLNFQFYHSNYLLYLEYEKGNITKDQFEFWEFISRTYGNIHDLSFDLTVDYINEIQNQMLDQMQNIPSLFNTAKITSKIHCHEHHFVDCAKWGRIRTHTAAPGESYLRNLKEASSKSHRTMGPALLNYVEIRERLKLIKIIFQKLKFREENGLIVARIRNMIDALNKSRIPSFKRPGAVVMQGNIKSVKRYFNPDTNETVKISSVVQRRSTDCYALIDMGEGGIRIGCVKSICPKGDEIHVQLATDVPNLNLSKYNLRKMQLQTNIVIIPTSSLKRKVIGFRHSLVNRIFYFMNYY